MHHEYIRSSPYTHPMWPLSPGLRSRQIRKPPWL
jgi:hypothetical protein